MRVAKNYSYETFSIEFLFIIRGHNFLIILSGFLFSISSSATLNKSFFAFFFAHLLYISSLSTAIIKGNYEKIGLSLKVILIFRAFDYGNVRDQNFRLVSLGFSTQTLEPDLPRMHLGRIPPGSS